MKNAVGAARLDEVQYGSRIIKFEVGRSDRYTLAISVLPDRRVIVSAPFDASNELIRNKVLKRADWIIRRQLEFQEMEKLTPERRYVPGETHWYLGRQYRLKFLPGDTLSISIQSRFLQVKGTREPDEVRALLERWYKDRAREHFSALVEKYWSKLGGDNNHLPELVVRELEKRWGSCTAKGHLIVNWQLVKAPSVCIEYVMVHELCHLFEHNHGPRFLALIDRYLPDWRERKARLERIEF